MRAEGFTVAETADYFGVNKTTVNKWCHNGKINATPVKSRGRSGFAFIIPESEIERLEKKMKHKETDKEKQKIFKLDEVALAGFTDDQKDMLLTLSVYIFNLMECGNEDQQKLLKLIVSDLLDGEFRDHLKDVAPEFAEIAYSTMN